MKKILGISTETLKDIQELFTETDIQELSLTENDNNITISRKSKHVTIAPAQAPIATPTPAVAHTEAPAPAPLATPTQESGDPYADTSKYEKVTSPIFGTFYTSPSPESPDFVSMGGAISTGSTICIVEAMKIFNEIKSTASGTVVSILKQKGDHVNVDDVLYIIEKN